MSATASSGQDATATPAPRAVPSPAVEVTPFISMDSRGSFPIGAAISFPLNSIFSIEAEIDYRRGEGRLNALSSSANLLYVLPRIGRMTPYVATGAGLAQYGAPIVSREGSVLDRAAQVGDTPEVDENGRRRPTIPGPEERIHASVNLEARTEENVHNYVARSARGWLGESSPVRIGLVLSGGGLRGASHVGVMQQLIEHDIPIDVMVGSSAGAIITAYYAAVGLTLDELIEDAESFRGRQLLAHCLSVRLRGRLGEALTKLTGLIPERLAQLESATFNRLHHNVRAIGIACHDVRTRRPCYFATGADRSVRLSDVVRASASIPFLLPPIGVESPTEGTTMLLADGGVSGCLPIEFAQQPPLAATHLIVSDCRWFSGRRVPNNRRLVYVRPRLPSTGTLWAPRSTLTTAVREGRRAVTRQMLDTIHGWVHCLAT
jgi:predicted acylesterase/phospholipase RssA